MASNWPQYPAEVLNGDDPTHSPQKTQNTILGAERGSQLAKRLETDSQNNLYVRVAADDTSAGLLVSPLAVGTQTGVTANTLTTITTYAAIVQTQISMISCSGTVYAKFQLFKNTVSIDVRRSGPDRSIQFGFESPLVLVPGDILDVKVTHYVVGSLEDFEATVYGA